MLRRLVLVLLLVVVSGCGSATGVRQVEPRRAVELVRDGWTVVDVRTPAEFAQGHVTGARLVDVTAPTFEAEIGKLDKGGRYVVYCRSGNRSAAAAEKMSAAGFRDVADAGGYEALVAAGMPVG